MKDSLDLIVELLEKRSEVQGVMPCHICLEKIVLYLSEKGYLKLNPDNPKFQRVSDSPTREEFCISSLVKEALSEDLGYDR